MLRIIAFLLLLAWPVHAQQQVPAQSILGNFTNTNPFPQQALPITTFLSNYIGAGISVLSSSLTTCNGVANDTAGIAAVIATGAKSIYIPVGYTCLVSQVLLPANVTFQIMTGATLRKTGTTNISILKCTGNNVTILGPGIIDGNNLSTGNVNVECSGFNNLVVDSLDSRNAKLHDIIMTDMPKATITNSKFSHNNYFANVAFYSTTVDAADVVISNNYCDRSVLGSVASGGTSCFYFIPAVGRTVSRVRIQNNTCLGLANDPITDEASCVIFLGPSAASFDIFPEAFVAFNSSSNLNFPFSTGGVTNGNFVGNTARGAGPNGYCYEIANTKDTSFTSNDCDGTFPTGLGAAIIFNNATGVSFVGGSVRQRSTDAGAIAFQALSSNAQIGRRNVISGVYFDVFGGTGISIVGDNYLVTGNILQGNSAGTNAINMNLSGDARIITNNVTNAWTATAIVNLQATDVVCGNTTLGCTLLSSANGFTGAELVLGGGAGTTNAISTIATGAPVMYFGHYGTGNTGSWTWANGTGAATGRMSLSGAGALNVVGTATANSFIPNASTVPSNGLYLPAANTLGWAVNTTALMKLTGTELAPAVSGGPTLGTAALPWKSLYLAAGGVIAFNNAETITQTTGILTFGGTNLVVNKSTPQIRLQGLEASGRNAAIYESAGALIFEDAGINTWLNLNLTTGVFAHAATTTSTSTATGGATFAGGVGIVGATYGGGIISARSNTGTPAAASAVAGFAMGSAGIGIYWGTGSPNTFVTAPQGSLYIRTDGSTNATRAYVNTDGATAWTAITTAT